ncbi:peptidoglycan D,D-transpeptidase FtsI family protein [Streptacidiphilus sp. N1-3]|uniref:Peptidoglycan D,D-transpeptidase FtsI family protein n=1 Tax=Streptacidiphilus alkalitolerans TaxID=3342712 RepID=A0ABV6XAE6_9ACTN
MSPFGRKNSRNGGGSGPEPHAGAVRLSLSRTSRRAGEFCLVLILVLLVNCTRVQVLQAKKYNDNAANQRAVIARYSEPRGDILVAGRAVTGNTRVESGAYTYRRTYTDGPLYAPVTGFSSQTFGNSLLEGVEDGVLAGTDSDLASHPLLNAISRAQVPGGDVLTTINAKAQRAAFAGLGSKRGAVAAIEPATGKILALASTPSYDPGTITGTGSAATANWNRLNNASTQPMLNRALRQTYPPGSTFKVVTLSAGLADGVYSGIDVPTDSPDPFTPADTSTPITNESASDACANATLRYALEVSCNTVFGKLGDDVGQSGMVKAAEAFGFNQTGQTVPVGVVPSVFDTAMTSKALLALSSIGQYNTAATPLEMASVTAAIANGGLLMKPQLVASTTGADGTVLKSFGPEEFGRPISAAVADQVQQAMVTVVTSGTGGNAAIPGVTVGGKTGTAQNGVGNSGTPYAWFISWARPGGATASPVAVAVVIEDSDANRADVSGGGLAAPIARSVMQAVLGG